MGRKPKKQISIRQYILDTYISKTMQDYYAQKGYEWTDSFLAGVVGQSVAYEDDKISLYREFAKETDDQELKQQLEEACREIYGAREAFRSADDRSVYLVNIFSTQIHRDLEMGLFADEALAEEVCSCYSEDKSIIRYKPLVSLDEADPEAVAHNCFLTEQGHMYFDGDGRIYESFDYANAEKTFTWKDQMHRFELRYVGIRHPFRAGDIVKAADSKSGYGVVGFYNTDEEMEQAIESRRGSACLMDDTVVIEIIGVEGDLGECNVYPWDLDLIPWDEAVRSMTQDGVPKTKIDLLMAISRLKKGVGNLSTVLKLYEKSRVEGELKEKEKETEIIQPEGEQDECSGSKGI